MAEPIVIFLGDEDRAMEALGAALQLFESGATGTTQIAAGTTVAIDRTQPSIVIHAEFLPQYQLLMPYTVEGGALGEYAQYMLGYSHRKDAMTPAANVQIFDQSGTGWQAGAYDFQYASDGMGTIAFVQAESILVPEQGVGVPTKVTLATIGVPEDWVTNAVNVGTPLGVKSAAVTVDGVGCVQPMALTEWFTSAPYGVVRTSPRKMIAALALVQQPSGTIYEQQYTANSNTRFMGYSLCRTSLVLLTATEGAASSAVQFNFGNDIIYEYDRASGGGPEYPNGSGVTAPTPIVIPLGNHSVLFVTRTEVLNAQKFFGRDFTIKAYHITGESPLAYNADTSALLATHFGSQDISYTDPSVPWPGMAYARNTAVFRHYGFFAELARNCRNSVPLDNGYTLVFTKITHGLFPFIPGPPPYNEQYVCLACDSTGIYPRGVVDTYQGDNYAPHNSTYGPLVDHLWDYVYLGAVCVGGGNVIVFIRRTLVWPYLMDDGILRYTSSDSGTTWSEPTYVTNDVMGTSEYHMTPPKWVGPANSTEPATGLDDAKLVSTIYLITPDGAAQKIEKLRLITSNDGGQSWTSASTPEESMHFDVNNPFTPYNPVSGFAGIHITGNHEEGFAPSPYTNVPNFYGAYGKASRDSQDDPNL